MADPRPVNTGFDPEFGQPLKRFRDALAAQGIQTNIISGVRSPQEHQMAWDNFQAGQAGQPLPHPGFGPVPRATPPGETSTHDVGLGADVRPVNPADLPRMYAMAHQFGIDYLGARDPYHFQLGNWQQTAANQPAATPWSQVGPSGNLVAQGSEPISATTSSPGGKFKVPGTTITSTGDSASSPVDYRQSLYQSLIGKGLNPEQARGVLISMMGESGQGLNPGAFNPKDPGGAMGFAQWVGPRRAGLQATAKALGTTETDPTAQVAYFNSEISGPYAKVLDRVKQAKDAAEANQIWTTGFERPAKDNSAERFAGNQNAIVIDKSGAPVFSTNAPAAPAVASGATGTAAGAPPAGAGAFGGFKTQADADAFQKNLSNLDKSMGGKGLGQGQQAGGEGGPPDVQPSQMIGPPPQAMNVSPLLAMVPMTYGQTINSLQDPLSWNSNPPGRPPPAPRPTGAGMQGPMGTSLNSLDPSMTPFPQSPISGMGYMGMGYGYPGGGMSYG